MSPQVRREPPPRPRPKSIREPKGSGLLAWFAQHAADEGISVNGALVRALEQYRAAAEGSSDEEPPQRSEAA